MSGQQEMERVPRITRQGQIVKIEKPLAPLGSAVDQEFSLSPSDAVARGKRILALLNTKDSRKKEVLLAKKGDITLSVTVVHGVASLEKKYPSGMYGHSITGTNCRFLAEGLIAAGSSGDTPLRDPRDAQATPSDACPELVYTVVQKAEEVLPALLRSIRDSGATQVLVTGREAYVTLNDQQAAIRSTLGNHWTVAGPDDPTEEGMSRFIQRFAEEIEEDPAKPRLRFGPTHEHVVARNLFRALTSGDYKGAIYVVGVVEEMLSYLSGLLEAFTGSDRASGYVEYVLYTWNRDLLSAEREKLEAALGQPELLNQVVQECLESWSRGQGFGTPGVSSDTLRPKKWWQFWE